MRLPHGHNQTHFAASIRRNVVVSHIEFAIWPVFRRTILIEKAILSVPATV